MEINLLSMWRNPGHAFLGYALGRLEFYREKLVSNCYFYMYKQDLISMWNARWWIGKFPMLHFALHVDENSCRISILTNWHTFFSFLFLDGYFIIFFFSCFQVHNYKYVPVVWHVVQNKWNKSCGLCPKTNMAREFSQKLDPFRGYLTNEGRNLTVSIWVFDRCLVGVSQVKIVGPQINQLVTCLVTCV